MTEYSKFNIVYRLQKWMDSVPGQTFLNYAYSWGASIVILGTLFKLTHLPGANVMLFLGMGTEVLVFFISAFDRPFDKTQEGMDLAIHAFKATTDDDDKASVNNNDVVATPRSNGASRVAGNQTVVVPVSLNDASKAANVTAVEIENGSHNLGSVPPINTEVVDAQNNYIEELKKLVDTLSKVNEQSTRLTRDSEEMENLNRTLTGISKVYEMQLKSASQQIGTIDQINEQSRKMAEQIEQLNKIYARMIEAMTVNMQVARPAGASRIKDED
jgi:gliding motility-associated protein GldL